MGIFKACDIRGIYGDDLTDQTAYRIGRALGVLLQGKSVLIGGDVRLSTPPLKSAISSGLADSGISVTDIGIVPTPVFYFAKHYLRMDAGVMVTASHNPPRFNGFKLAIGDLPITEDEIASIKHIAESSEFIDGNGNISYTDVTSQYNEYILSVSGKPESDFKVVVDCGNGCFSNIAPDVFAGLGYDVIRMFCEPDGTFPNRNPNSAVAANLRELSRRVVDESANLGVAFDGDGDRVSFVDDRGRMISADKCIVILSRWLLQKNAGDKVVYDLKCSSVVPESIKTLSGTPVPERSGHTFIKTSMIREGAVFGGEISGHYFYRELHGGDDGLYSALLMAEQLACRGEKLSEIADSVPEYTITPDLRIPFEGNGREVIEKIAGSFPSGMISRIDGVKVDFGNGWGLARVSVTEPVITMRFESAKPDDLNGIIHDFLSAVPDLYQQVMQTLSKKNT